MDTPRHGMSCRVFADEEVCEAITLVEPPITHHVTPVGGAPVDICEYAIRGASFVANEREPKTEGKKDITVLFASEVDVLHLNDLELLGVEPECIVRIELRIGGGFIAFGVLDTERKLVNFFETVFDYPIGIVTHHSFEIWTYHTCEDHVPEYAISAYRVTSDAERKKLNAVKLNLLFRYAGCDDMNILSIKNGMAGLRYPHIVVESDSKFVRCLLKDKPEPGRVFSPQEMEDWLNRCFVFTPPLPVMLPMIEHGLPEPAVDTAAAAIVDGEKASDTGVVMNACTRVSAEVTPPSFEKMD